MNKVATESEFDFESDGWGVIRGFIEPGELAPIAADLNEALGHPRPPCMSRPGNDLIPLRWSDAVVTRILHSQERLRRLRELLQARDLKWLSGYVSIKAPHSPVLWWHQDWWCWDHPISFCRSSTQVAVLCYLADTSEENGALRVIPGSHHQSTAIHGELPEPHGEYANSLLLDHPAMADHPDQRTASVRAGDAVVLDYRLLHSTHANVTPYRRDCVLLSFITNWRELPSELKAHLMMHPALPAETEASLAKGYADLLPHFAGTPTSVKVNRMAPAIFRAQ